MENVSVKKRFGAYAAMLFFLLLLAAIVFRCVFEDGRIFSGSDSNIGLIAANHRVLPDRFTGAFGPAPVIGGASSIPFSCFNIGRWLLPPEIFSNTWYGFYLILSSVFMVAYLRLWRIQWPACLVGALTSFWVGSVTLSAAGHLNKLGVMMLFTLALYLLEKGVRYRSLIRRLLWALGAGVAVGFMLLEQQDVALFAGLFLGPYVLARLVMNSREASAGGRKARGGTLVLMWTSILLPVALCGILMSGAVAANAYKKNVTDTGLKSDPDQKWDFITQWSMVPAEWPDLIAPGYTGWSTGNPEGPYWGKIGRSRDWEKTRKGFQNFRLDSLYIGIIPLLLAGVAFWQAFKQYREDRTRSVIVFIWGVFALTALLLSFGKYSPLYKLFYQFPLVNNIRAPIKFLHNFQVFIGILAAFGLNGLLQLKAVSLKKTIIVLGGVALLLLLGVLGTASEQFKNWGQYADLITKTSRLAWTHALVMVLLGFALMVAANRSGFFKQYGVCFLILMLAADSVLLTSKYFKSQDISELRRGNPVINFLKENQGHDRIYLMDSQGVYSRWISTDAGYHGLHIFNIWQMPRMPADLKAYLGAAGKNQLRLWQLSAVKYITAPADVLTSLPEPLKAALVPRMYYRFMPNGDGVTVREVERPALRGDQVLLEYRDTLPRFAFYSNWLALPVEQHLSTMFSPNFNPLQSILVEPGSVPEAENQNVQRVMEMGAEVTRKDAVIHTKTDHAGVLLFNQRYQPEWKVMIDGQPAEVFRCNYIFPGVHVPAGEHTIRFYID